MSFCLKIRICQNTPIVFHYLRVKQSTMQQKQMFSGCPKCPMCSRSLLNFLLNHLAPSPPQCTVLSLCSQSAPIPEINSPQVSKDVMGGCNAGWTPSWTTGISLLTPPLSLEHAFCPLFPQWQPLQGRSLERVVGYISHLEGPCNRNPLRTVYKFLWFWPVAAESYLSWG